MMPSTNMFYNGGAKVTTEGSVSIEDLKNMEAQGVEIRTCGTCLNYYGLTDKLAVGSVTNMYDIVETMTSAFRLSYYYYITSCSRSQSAFCTNIKNFFVHFDELSNHLLIAKIWN